MYLHRKNTPMQPATISPSYNVEREGNWRMFEPMGARMTRVHFVSTCLFLAHYIPNEVGKQMHPIFNTFFVFWSILFLTM